MNASNEAKYLSPDEKQELLEAMDAHFKIFVRARSLTPYISKSYRDTLILDQYWEVTPIPAAPFYIKFGYSYPFFFFKEQFNSDEKYQQFQDIGHWINQSFLIELKCIVDTFITDWNSCPLKDDKYFELLRYCRHLFAHNSFQLGYKQRKGHEQDFKQAYILYKERPLNK